jgi:hypothetical protein
VGAETDAARAEVLASREALLSEVQRLEASARAAVDIPGKIRRAPAKTAGLAAGTAFVVLGGPQRLFRRARRVVLGPKADLPKSMLPDEVEKAVRKLGDDGDRVRATLEREFAKYLEDRSKLRKQTEVAALATVVAANLLKPLSSRFGRQLAQQLFSPDSAGFDEAVAKVRARYLAQTGGSAAEASAAGEPTSGAATGRSTSKPAPVGRGTMGPDPLVGRPDERRK